MEIGELFYSFSKKMSVLSVLLTVLAGVVFADATRPVEPAALDAAGIGALQKAYPHLDGSGVTLAAVCRSRTYLNGIPQNDYRFNMRHHSLRDADVLFEDHSDGRYGISPHATAIGGILVGVDPQAALPGQTPFEYRGAVPYAAVDVYEFWRFAALWLFAQKPISADILTLSLGDIYEDWWTRGIEHLAAQNGTVIVAAIGNGQAGRDPALYPAAGANVIGVGVIDSVVDQNGSPALNDFTVPTLLHSSRGPAFDRRSKPDIVAPGTALVPDAYTENGYTVVANASSLAAPIVAATAALLLQQAAGEDTLRAAVSDTPVNCLVKAVLMNSARKLPYWHKGGGDESDDVIMPLDRLQGAGALDAAAAMAQLTAGRQTPGTVPTAGWDSRTLHRHEILYYDIHTPDPNTMLTATLTWNRHFEDRYPFRLRPEQSDLRLEVWAVDPDDPDAPILLDVSDSPIDTVEHLWTPLLGGSSHYRIAVQFSPNAELSASDAESFALAWSVGLDSSAHNPLWEDLNGDGQRDASDRFLKSLLIQDKGRLDLLDTAFYEQALGLGRERAELLTALWHRWQPYLTIESEPIID